ncbi:hypothetical protein [Pseudomonas sp. 14P_5.3_Bac1]|uniref:hypothetical protein n=1 Tax=Pseudomonas sp. 14P_5.3_Bac1 TaxID=2971622 RepID=UPI0021CA6ED6|nr:hypothetical protein [Pseudomonas sp. 14P_5.3_Bac1]MCU1776396.1 hypothetical protein [Pseudomonas sp. 14P_5.3_Bac1]
MGEYVNFQGLAAGSQSPPLRAEFALGAWNDHWVMSHEAVRCRYCLAPQWPSNADDPVRHCAGCELIQAQYPLLELATILAEVHGVAG